MKGFKNMGTLKYAILGLLNRKNMTGPDHFQKGFLIPDRSGCVWHSRIQKE